MKKTMLILTSGLFSVFLTAQSSSPEVIASGGGFASGSGFTNSFTIGQGSITETFSSGTFMLTQGFQQPVDIGMGMAPINEMGDAAVFPNPSNGLFFLEYTFTENADVLIEVLDVLGQSVFSDKKSGYAGTQLYQIDLSTHASGIYFIHCTIKTLTETTTHTSKITLTR